jgi:predicted DNA-binding transcriptional regulator YafY
MAAKTASAAKRMRVSGQRAGRLYKLLKQLEKGPASRTQLVKRLKVGTRTFYRDIDLLRECGVKVETENDGYSLKTTLDAALQKLPFPDPQLTFGDVVTLQKGRTQSHKKLKGLLDNMTR